MPDALYKTAFQLFDTNGNGMVAFGKNNHADILSNVFRIMYIYLCLITLAYVYFVIDSTDEFVEVMRKTALHQRMPFNMDSSFIKLYFGKDKKRLISYAEFSQFLHVSVVLAKFVDRSCYSRQGSQPKRDKRQRL